MSRVDDDRQAQRASERAALQKREQELRAKERGTQDSVFSKLVNQGAAQKQVAQERPLNAAQAAIAQLKESLAEGTEKSATFAEAQAKAGAQRGTEGQVRAGDHAQAQQSSGRADSGKLQDASGQAAHADSRAQGEASAGMAAQGRASESGAAAGQASARGQAGRSADADKTREGLEERGSASASGAGGGRAKGRAGEGELRADADKGGGGGGQKGGDSKDGAGAAPAGFRFNPALMAPVPVAQKRDLAGSDRLRRIANEIAQKIVERVRVGTNKAGASEFQIDLRQDVLSGLSIKVSSRHGRISMVFAGRDGDTLKQLEAQAEGLKEALSQRGLQLDQMKFERTA